MSLISLPATSQIKVRRRIGHPWFHLCFPLSPTAGVAGVDGGSSVADRGRPSTTHLPLLYLLVGNLSFLICKSATSFEKWIFQGGAWP
jgi:hypothetical protein